MEAIEVDGGELAVVATDDFSVERVPFGLIGKLLAAGAILLEVSRCKMIMPQEVTEPMIVTRISVEMGDYVEKGREILRFKRPETAE